MRDGPAEILVSAGCQLENSRDNFFFRQLQYGIHPY